MNEVDSLLSLIFLKFLEYRSSKTGRKYRFCNPDFSSLENEIKFFIILTMSRSPEALMLVDSVAEMVRMHDRMMQ